MVKKWSTNTKLKWSTPTKREGHATYNKKKFKKWWKKNIKSSISKLGPNAKKYMKGWKKRHHHKLALKGLPHFKEDNRLKRLFSRNKWEAFRRKNKSLAAYLVTKGAANTMLSNYKKNLSKLSIPERRIYRKGLKVLAEKFKQYGWKAGKNYKSKGTLSRHHGTYSHPKTGKVELISIFSPGLRGTRKAIKTDKGFRFVSKPMWKDYLMRLQNKRIKKGNLPVKLYGWQKKAFNRLDKTRGHLYRNNRPPSPVY